VEEEMKKGQVGGVLIGKNRIWILAYVDDLVLLAKNEESMKETMRRLGRYLRNKNLKLNAEKSKMSKYFRKGEGRRRRVKWMCKEKRIEEVSEFKYLGYVLRKNGEDDGQIRELRKQGNIIMRKVWDLGERLFKNDFRRRMILFRYLVMGIIMYGAEIWGWREREELEVIQKKYIKWSLGFDSCTPDYIIYKESGTDKIRITAGYRAVKLEEKALKEGNRRLLIECREAREREKGCKGWMEKKESFFLQTK